MSAPNADESSGCGLAGSPQCPSWVAGRDQCTPWSVLTQMPACRLRVSSHSVATTRFGSWSANATSYSPGGTPFTCDHVAPRSVERHRPPPADAASTRCRLAWLNDSASTRPPQNGLALPAATEVGPRLTTSGGGGMTAWAVPVPSATTATAPPVTAMAPMTAGTLRPEEILRFIPCAPLRVTASVDRCDLCTTARELGELRFVQQ